MTKRRIHAEPRKPWTAEEIEAVKALYPDLAKRWDEALLGQQKRDRREVHDG